jgi:hypothetical protein
MTEFLSFDDKLVRDLQDNRAGNERNMKPNGEVMELIAFSDNELAFRECKTIRRASVHTRLRLFRERESNLLALCVKYEREKD